MRLQLALLLISTVAYADGEIDARAVYYKERATRVEQPMMDGMFEAGEHGIVTAHFLVDSITSASASSGAANAQPFTERRYELGAGYLYDAGTLRIGGDFKYSTESDYDSLYVGARVELDLAQKNAQVAAGAGISLDNVSTTNAGGFSGGALQCDPNDGASVAETCSLNTYSGFASFSQILSKNWLAAVTYDVALMDGYQSNPYRVVIINAKTEAERHPDRRLRQSFAGSMRYYLGATQTTFIGAYRYYRDDWHVYAKTPEIRAIQQVGNWADASLRYRYYTQSKAFFYQDRYVDDSYQYVSDDPKLSAFTGHTIEAKLGVYGETFGLTGTWGATRFEGLLEYEVQNNRFGNAVVAHVGLTIPLRY